MPRRFLAHPVVAWLGLVSYGIFLWHLTILSQLDKWGVTHAVHLFYFLPIVLAVLAVSTGFAAISYYALERPLLRLKERRASALIALPIVLVFALVFAFAVGTGRRQLSASLPTVCVILRSFVVQPAGCRPVSDDGRPLALRASSIRFSDGRQLPIVSGWVASSVDVSRKVYNGFLGEIAQIEGWAASAKGHGPASSILVFSSGRFLGAVKPTINRPDVAKAFKDNRLDRSGYVVDMPLAVVKRHGRARLELFGVQAGTVSRLPFDCKDTPAQFGC